MLATGHAAALPWPAARTAWYGVWLLNMAYLIAFVDRIILSMLMPGIQTDMQLSDTQLGLLSGVAFGFWYTMLGLPAGYLADRANRRNLIVAGMIVWSLMTMACGLAGSFMALFIFRMGVGTGEAVLHPAATSMIGDYFAPEKRARAFGIYLMAGTAGVTISFLVGGPLVASLTNAGDVHLLGYGPFAPWQATFVIVGLPGILLALLILGSMREPPRRLSEGAAKGASWTELRQFLSHNRRTMACHVLGVPILLIGTISIISWLPIYYLRTFDWNVARTSVSYALTGGIAGMVGALLVGYLPNWLRRRGYSDATFRTCLITGIWLNLFGCLAMLSSDPYLALALLTVSAFASIAPAISALTCVGEIVPNRMRARVTAIYSIMVGLIANSLGPFLVGFITDRVFGDPAAIGHALLLVLALSGTLGSLLVYAGLGSYRRTLAEAERRQSALAHAA
jgi:MFS family permease